MCTSWAKPKICCQGRTARPDAVMLRLSPCMWSPSFPAPLCPGRLTSGDDGAQAHGLWLQVEIGQQRLRPRVECRRRKKPGVVVFLTPSLLGHRFGVAASHWVPLPVAHSSRGQHGRPPPQARDGNGFSSSSILGYSPAVAGSLKPVYTSENRRGPPKLSPPQ